MPIYIAGNYNEIACEEALFVSVKVQQSWFHKL